MRSAFGVSTGAVNLKHFLSLQMNTTLPPCGTTDSSFSAHLINCGFDLVEVDRSTNRHNHLHAIEPEEFDRELRWYNGHHIADTIRIAKALGAAAKGLEIKPLTVKLWPCLAVAVEGGDK